VLENVEKLLLDPRARENALHAAEAECVATLTCFEGRGRSLSEAEFNTKQAAEGKLNAIRAELRKINPVRLNLTPEAFSAPFAESRMERGTNQSLRHALRAAMQTASEDQRQQVNALVGYLQNGPMAAADLTPGGDGGVLLPTFVQSVIERNYSQFDSVRSVARRVGTDNGADFVFPVLSDSESAAQVASAAATGADATVSGDTPPTDLTGPTLKAWKVSSKPVFVPRETGTDADIDILGELLAALIARIIRFENLKFTKGAGTTEAEGFLTGATPFEESGGVLSLDAALDLMYSVPALYRANAVYMCSDATAKFLRKLKTGISGDKTQLWGDGNHTLGTPSTLHGWPVIINNDMTDVSSDGTYSSGSCLAAGDFSRFVIREAENNSPFIYNYAVPAKDGRAVIAFRRTDSKLLVPEAISKLTVGGS
jgi:HK97 family phage major capsid protein